MAAQLVFRRHEGKGGKGAALGRPFIVGEEKEFVAEDRPAEIAAELIAAQRRLIGPEVEGVARVEDIVAKEFKSRPMKIVCPGPDRCVNDGGCAAIIGGKSVLHYLEFLQRFN